MEISRGSRGLGTNVGARRLEWIVFDRALPGVPNDGIGSDQREVQNGCSGNNGSVEWITRKVGREIIGSRSNGRTEFNQVQIVREADFEEMFQSSVEL